jgi:hypothetical protein
MVKKETAGLNLNFGVSVPEQTRSSRYVALYDLLRENPGEWADVTDAVALLAAGDDGKGKVPGPQATAITLRKKGFEASTRKTDDGGRVFARFVPETEEG